MGNRKERMEACLHKRLTPERLEVINETAAHHGHAGDDGSGESHFCVVISSPSFTQKTKIECHRMVNDALKEFFDEGLHALRIIIQ